MIKHRWRELAKSFGSQVDPEKAEELKRTKTDIDNNLTRILKLIKNEEQTKKDGNLRDSRKETELVGLIEDFYNQYQSLYALYDRLTGEYGKLVPRQRGRTVSSLSSSSSDSEYFSSDEIEASIRRSEKEQQNVSETIKQELVETEREHSTLADADEVLGNQALLTEIEELEKQLTCKNKEVESLKQQKGELSAKNTGLHARVLELELLLKDKGSEVSSLRVKLKNKESHEMSNVAVLMAQINKLELEAKSLRTQKAEMEEKIISNRIEAESHVKGLTGQLNTVKQNLDSLHEQKKELEVQMEEKREEVSQYLIKIQDMKEKLAEKDSVEDRVLQEKERFLVKTKDLELEVESRCNQKNELEEQLRNRNYEITRMADENKSLEDRNLELKRAITERGEELSAILREHESGQDGASIQGMALIAQVNDLRLELDSLKEEKTRLEVENERNKKERSERLEKMENLNIKLASKIADQERITKEEKIKLELENERNKKEYSESMAEMENLNIKLASKIADQERFMKEQVETVDRMSGEFKQANVWSKKIRSNGQITERKMEELAQEFRKKIEDNIRLLYQRIHVAEQLHNENKDSYKITKKMYEEENRMLKEKIASYEDELRKSRVMRMTPMEALNGLDLLAGLDLAAGKLEERKGLLLSRVSKMVGEVEVAKDWIKKRNSEMKQLKDNVNCLTALLDDKEEQEFLLREKVWKLEAQVSKEGGEKLNLMKAVSQLEKKMGKLEKNIKEKDEELVNQGEKKREAIRQLCFLNDYHRNRCDYLKDMITKMWVNSMKRA